MSSTRGEAFPQDEAKPFRMLSIYDSPDSRREAAHASAIILNELGEDIVADEHAWDLQSLEAAENLEQAAHEAAQADVIVLALATRAPSESLKNWANRWQQKRELTSGLLALIPSGKSATGGDLAEFLYEMAVTANMDFLCRKPRRFETGE